jgi:Fusaric acid resistance protein-like
METLSLPQKRLAGLARAVRAAIAVPTLFALALLVIEQPQMAGFAVFGTFAHLVIVDYDTIGRARSAEAAALTVLGAAMVSLGTLVSTNIPLAVGGAVAIGFLAESPALARIQMVALRTMLLLAFMLAAAVPAAAGSAFPRLAGWLLAGVAAQPILLLVWFPIRASEAAKDRGANPVRIPRTASWIGRAVGSGAAMGLAMLLTRVLRLDHAFWIVLGVVPLLNPKGSRAIRTFWQEQVGTLIGFIVGALLVAIIGAHRTGYWVVLPLAVFASAYVSTAVSFMAGQAAFTVFAIVLFCILLPQQGSAGIVRVEDIALGGAISMAVGALRRGIGTPLDAARKKVGSKRRRSRYATGGDSPSPCLCAGRGTKT